MNMVTASPIPNPAQPHATAVGAVERRILAVAAAIGLHVVLLAVGAAAAALVATGHRWQVIPRDPLRLVAISLVMAHCSLGAIWWARTRLSPNIKTLLAVALCGGLWLLLINLLQSTQESGLVSSAWAASVAAQVLITALAAMALDLWLDYRAAAARSRFSVSFLLIGTSIVAVALGGISAWGERQGWRIADVSRWQFFSQLQCVAICNAALAFTLFAGVRWAIDWRARAPLMLAATIVVAALATAVMDSIFGENVGAEKVAMVWLFTAEGLFLTTTLLPWEIARRPN
jgi:hypothetical protein